ncbi:MAG: hypothetical protein AAB299_02805, partial [Thermodesulfobacteriota bacterium]
SGWFVFLSWLSYIEQSFYCQEKNDRCFFYLFLPPTRGYVRERPNPSIKRTATGKPVFIAHVKRLINHFKHNYRENPQADCYAMIHAE